MISRVKKLLLVFGWSERSSHRSDKEMRGLQLFHSGIISVRLPLRRNMSELPLPRSGYVVRHFRSTRNSADSGAIALLWEERQRRDGGKGALPIMDETAVVNSRGHLPCPAFDSVLPSRRENWPMPPSLSLPLEILCDEDLGERGSNCPKEASRWPGSITRTD